jgi:hypothetical protein
MRNKKIMFSALFFFLLSAANLNANQLILDLDTAYLNPAATPVGTVPWLTAEFTDIADNSVQLTMSTSGLETGVSQSVGNWFFNVTDSLLGLLNFQYVSGSEGSIFLAPNQRVAGGDLSFDIEFDFAAAQFAPGTQSTYLISSLDSSQPISSESFALDSIFSPTQSYYSAALVEGVGSWIAASSATIIGPGPGPGPDPAPVPEAATIVLLGFGLSGLLAFGRKKFSA